MRQASEILRLAGSRICEAVTLQGLCKTGAIFPDKGTLFLSKKPLRAANRMRCDQMPSKFIMAAMTEFITGRFLGCHDRCGYRGLVAFRARLWILYAYANKTCEQEIRDAKCD